MRAEKKKCVHLTKKKISKILWRHLHSCREGMWNANLVFFFFFFFFFFCKQNKKKVCCPQAFFFILIFVFFFFFFCIDVFIFFLFSAPFPYFSTIIWLRCWHAIGFFLNVCFHWFVGLSSIANEVREEVRKYRKEHNCSTDKIKIPKLFVQQKCTEENGAHQPKILKSKIKNIYN